MSRILASHPKSVQGHKDLILQCLDDRDESIRLRALDLLYGMVSHLCFDLLCMGVNIPLSSGHPLLPFPMLLTPLPLFKIMQLAERSTGRALMLIDYNIAPRSLNTICTSRPVNYTCNLG